MFPMNMDQCWAADVACVCLCVPVRGCEDNLITEQIERVTEVNILHALFSSLDTVIALSTLGSLLTLMAF